MTLELVKIETFSAILTFTQNVQEISVYHLKAEYTDAGSMQRIMNVKKASDIPLALATNVRLNNQTIMQYFKSPKS